MAPGGQYKAFISAGRLLLEALWRI